MLVLTQCLCPEEPQVLYKISQRFTSQPSRPRVHPANNNDSWNLQAIPNSFFCLPSETKQTGQFAQRASHKRFLWEGDQWEFLPCVNRWTLVRKICHTPGGEDWMYSFLGPIYSSVRNSLFLGLCSNIAFILIPSLSIWKTAKQNPSLT